MIIFSHADIIDHWEKVKEVLERLNNAGLKLDPQKCKFAVKETKYLGFIINVDKGICADPKKVQAILTWEPPTDLKGVRSFLGFSNFYRSFIKNFALISEPLQMLTKKETPFKWRKEQQNAFVTLKHSFSTAPILAMWQENKETVLETDASGWATGGCLSQFDKAGCLRLVAYHSKKLNPAECNYNIHDKELLSIISCLNEWRDELIGLDRPFTILTDHKNLKYFMTSRRLTERQVRWSQFLAQFNFVIKFRAGKNADRPDALSRRSQDIPKGDDDPRLKEREF